MCHESVTGIMKVNWAHTTSHPLGRCVFSFFFTPISRLTVHSHTTSVTNLFLFVFRFLLWWHRHDVTQQWHGTTLQAHHVTVMSLGLLVVLVTGRGGFYSFIHSFIPLVLVLEFTFYALKYKFILYFWLKSAWWVNYWCLNMLIKWKLLGLWVGY